jgi:hypothetical protein
MSSTRNIRPADPAAARTSWNRRIFLVALSLSRNRYEIHAADGALAGARLANLRMHGAGQYSTPSAGIAVAALPGAAENSAESPSQNAVTMAIRTKRNFAVEVNHCFIVRGSFMILSSINQPRFVATTPSAFAADDADARKAEIKSRGSACIRGPITQSATGIRQRGDGLRR